MTIETLVYDVVKDKLDLGRRQPDDESQERAGVVRELATAVSAEMRKSGLVPIVR